MILGTAQTKIAMYLKKEEVVVASANPEWVIERW